MPMVDADGRLWGRINLVDAVIAVLVIGLVPLTYGAYALLKTPPPSLTSIEPASLTAGPNLKVVVNGVDLRPYLRVSFDTIQGKSFLFEHSTRAQVELNEMPPGVYDVILYDYREERTRLPKALTILAAPATLPTTTVIAVGRFTNLTPEVAAQIKAGMRLSGRDEILAVGSPMPSSPKVYAGATVIDVPVTNFVQVPVVLRMGCDVRAASGQPECFNAPFPLRPTFMMPLPTPMGELAFQIDQLSGDAYEVVDVTVRVAGPAAAIAALRRGDVDTAMADNPLAAGATVANLAGERRLAPDVAEVTVTFRVRAHRGGGGWIYSGAPIRIGSPFTFRAPRYETSGGVLSLNPVRAAAPGKPD